MEIKRDFYLNKLISRKHNGLIKVITGIRRYTHVSLLLFVGVSIASVAHRLGHASMTTTQKAYLRPPIPFLMNFSSAVKYCC